MKRKINSIWFGGRVIALGLLFSFFIPIIIKLIIARWSVPLLQIISKVSFFIGIIIIGIFCIIIAIEFKQDKYLNNFYEENKNSKIPLENGQFECQSCGNRDVNETDILCKVCGIHFTKNN